MTDSLHAFYSPSAMHRIVRCPGSVRATANMPDIPSPYAQDGTDAHAALSYALSNGIREAHTLCSYVYPAWTFRADTYEERVEALQFALDEVYAILDAYSDAQLYLETRVTFPSNATDQCWGTADIIIVVPSMRLLYVIDYKHGAGTYVEAKDNEQLGVYARSALVTIREAAKCDTVITGIIQPRAFAAEGPFRTDAQSANYYETVFQQRIDNAIVASQQIDAMLIPGEKQCKFCPLKANCPAREAAALAVVSNSFSSVKDVTSAALPSVSQIPVDRLAYIMAAATVLKGWLKDVEDTAYAAAKGGVYVPGFKLVETQARRQWHQDENETAKLIMSLATTDIDTVMPRKLLTITEAEKLVVDAFKETAPRGRKKAAAENAKVAFAQLTTKQSSGSLVLVPESDNRIGVNPAHVAFKSVVFQQESNDHAHNNM